MRARAQGMGKTKAVAAVRAKILSEVASLSAVLKQSKQCPTCKVAISKTAGCNKVRVQFTYVRTSVFRTP